jgi:uncharacterized protein (DUF58 family)
MPRIRVAVNGAMQQVDQAADAAENAANWAAALAQRVWKHGLEIDLVVPESVRAKLTGVRIVGPVLVALVDALDGVELRVKLGSSPTDN